MQRDPMQRDPIRRGDGVWLPVALVLAAGVIGAAVVLAVVFGLSQWSARSSPAVEELLPLAVPSDAAGVPVATDDSVVIVGDPGGANEPTEESPAIVVSPVLVHVAGAVVQPGVVELRSGDRVHDAVMAAGGPAASADLDRVNLAALVADGQHVVVPGSDEPVFTLAPQPSPAVGVSGSPVAGDPPMVDLNRATQTELEMLPGVGPATATAILAFRTERGGFFSVDELQDVPGIGPAKFAAVQGQVSIG